MSRDAFNEWFVEQLRTREDGPTYEDAFRAGMLAAAEIAMQLDHGGLTVQDAILAEADK